MVFLLATTDPGRLSEAFQSRPDKTVLWFYALEEMAGIVWLRSVETLGQTGLNRETCIEIAARKQRSPRPSVNVVEPLVASFYGAAEHDLERVPTREEVAGPMNATAVAQWFEDTQGTDRNGLTSEHVEYLKLLRTRGASAEEEIRRALGISNRGDFVIVSEYLTRLDLIRVGPGGRSLTSDGRRYLTASDFGSTVLEIPEQDSIEEYLRRNRRRPGQGGAGPRVPRGRHLETRCRTPCKRNPRSRNRPAPRSRPSSRWRRSARR